VDPEAGSIGQVSRTVIRATVVLFLALISVTSVILAQTPRPGAGRAIFERACARCHGADGRGGERGPGITTRIPLKTDQELAALVRAGLPAKGMPGFQFREPDLRQLLAFVRTLGRSEGTSTRQRRHC